MNTSRRELLLMTGTAGALSFLPVSLTSRERGPDSKLAVALPRGWNHAALSEAVLQGTVSACARAIALGTKSHEDLTVAIHLSQVFVDHLDEIGFLAATDRQVREAGDRLFEIEPTERLLSETKSVLRDHGSSIATEDLRRLLTVPPERRFGAIDKLRSCGFAHCANTAIKISRAAISSERDQALAPNSTLLPRPESACQEFQLIVDTILIVAALDGLGCLAGCVPCCGIAAGAALVGGILELIHDAMC